MVGLFWQLSCALILSHFLLLKLLDQHFLLSSWTIVESFLFGRAVLSCLPRIYYSLPKVNSAILRKIIQFCPYHKDYKHDDDDKNKEGWYYFMGCRFFEGISSFKRYWYIRLFDINECLHRLTKAHWLNLSWWPST
jgi:hypothetical protein